jgi:hypothetical protein
LWRGEQSAGATLGEGGESMQLIFYYVGFMIAGDIASYLIGLVVERQFGSHVSLIVFLALYFLFLWISWLLAVWFTQPKSVQPAGAA